MWSATFKLNDGSKVEFKAESPSRIFNEADRRGDVRRICLADLNGSVGVCFYYNVDGAWTENPTVGVYREDVRWKS